MEKQDCCLNVTKRSINRRLCIIARKRDQRHKNVVSSCEIQRKCHKAGYCCDVTMALAAVICNSYSCMTTSPDILTSYTALHFLRKFPILLYSKLVFHWLMEISEADNGSIFYFLYC